MTLWKFPFFNGIAFINVHMVKLMLFWDSVRKTAQCLQLFERLQRNTAPSFTNNLTLSKTMCEVKLIGNIVACWVIISH